jgi:hypothetical protein
MTEDIKRLAGQISEGYLNHGENMNEAAFNCAQKHRLNEELIRRLCEFANQNTYLSMFHTDKAKRGNITFKLAMAEEIIKKIKELNMADNDYLKAPADFRLTDEYGQEHEGEEDSTDEKPETSLDDQIQNLQKKLRLSDRLGILLSAIKTMKASEEGSAEENVLKLSSYCKGLIFNGESFGDMSKLAMRYTQQREFNIEKTAKLMSTIGEYLSDKGFKVPMELTKTSSMKINEGSEIYQPIEQYHMSLIKIAGLNEMAETLEKVCAFIRMQPKKEAGLTSAVK